MKEMVKIRYQSIICHENEQVKDDLEMQATREWQLGQEVWLLNHPQHGKMEIVIRGQEVILTYGISTLRMRLNKKMTIAYQTMYGTLSLETHLRKLQVEKRKLALVYDLLDHGVIISKCYLVITMINPALS